MKFHIDKDDPRGIKGWLLPDDPMLQPSVTVSLDGAEPVTVVATDVRNALRNTGQHSTGQCGFDVNEKTVPGFAKAKSIEIHDALSGVLVYRRLGAKARPIQAKAAFLRLLFNDYVPIDGWLADRFQVAHLRVDRPQPEVMQSILALTASSVFVSGRFMLAPFRTALRSHDFKLATILREPYEELAARLITLREIMEQGGESIGAGLSAALKAAASFAMQVEPNPRSIRAAMAGFDPDALTVLSNPYVRQIACEAPGDIPTAHHLKTSLHTLSEAAVVGTADNLPSFFEIMGTVVGQIEPPEVIEPANAGDIAALAEAMRAEKSVRPLVALDLDLYDIVAAAVSRSERAVLSLLPQRERREEPREQG